MRYTIKALFLVPVMGVLILTSQGNTRHQAKDETVSTVDTASADKLTDHIDTTQVPLTLTIENLKSGTAPIIVSVYGVKSKFPDPNGQLKEYKFKPTDKKFTTQIRGLKFGTYAIATYQDENSSGKIDKNFIGMPTEGFAFSNNFKPTVKAPSFEQCKFDYNKESNSVSIKMIQ